MSRWLPFILLSTCVCIAAVAGVSGAVDGPTEEREQAVSAAATVPAAQPPSRPVPAPVVQRRGGVACAGEHITVDVDHELKVRSRPGGAVIGSIPARSVYLGQPMRVWVQATSSDGRWGKVTIPWVKPVSSAGWMELAGLQRSSTRLLVVADLSERMLRVHRGCTEIERAPIAVGRAGSPSPRGRFWVTDRIDVPAQQQDSFGTYAFGMSAVQPRLPDGWSGGNQMAIHGTGSPGSIGTAASAGCLRVSEETLDRLRPLLRAGTPVVITA